MLLRSERLNLVTTYQEALAKQRGKQFRKVEIEERRKKKRSLIGIPCYAKEGIPEGTTIFLQRDSKLGLVPCAHILNGHEQGDLLMAQIALIGPSSLPKMEVSNDNPPRLRD